VNPRLPQSMGWRATGSSLLETVIALAGAALLVLGLVQLASAASAADALQRNQAQILDRARFAFGVLARAARQAGFHPEPWRITGGGQALADGNRESADASGDRLVLQSWSDRNCFDNRNPEVDGAGQPRFYLRVQAFERNADGQLTHDCRYGPDADSLTWQIRRSGLIPGVEAFQVLYGRDANSDGDVDGWVHAGEWTDPRQVIGVRIGLLLVGDDVVTDAPAARIELLDASYDHPSDGRLRRTFDLTLAIRGRTG
jgi:type II secretory pathway component PulJ